MVVIAVLPNGTKVWRSKGEADRSDDRSTNCVEINISNYGISLDEESTGKLWPLLQELPHLEVLKLNHNDLK